jgi:hypothetical protein
MATKPGASNVNMDYIYTIYIVNVVDFLWYTTYVPSAYEVTLCTRIDYVKHDKNKKTITVKHNWGI